MRQVPLTVCHVREHAVTTSSVSTVPGSWPADRILSRGVTLARRQDRGLDVVPRLLAGRAAAVLLELSGGAQVLVAGTRGTGNWSWPGLGSVSNQLAARASCPLLLVPDDGIWRDGPVVVGVDGTPSSQHAAGFAFEEAHLRHVPVLAVCWSQEQARPRARPGYGAASTQMWHFPSRPRPVTRRRRCARWLTLRRCWSWGHTMPVTCRACCSGLWPMKCCRTRHTRSRLSINGDPVHALFCAGS